MLHRCILCLLKSNMVFWGALDQKCWLALRHVCGHVTRFWTNSLDLETLLTTCAVLPLLYLTLSGYYILLTELPNYMKNVLHWEEKAILTGVPYLAMWLVSGVSSILVDSIIERELMSRTGIRKIANTIATLGPALALLGRKLYFLSCIWSACLKMHSL